MGEGVKKYIFLIFSCSPVFADPGIMVEIETIIENLVDFDSYSGGVEIDGQTYGYKG